MSLVHWWPLNGNLRDYVGCNHLTVVNNNNKLQSNDLGFLGKCWERTAVGTTDLLRSTSKMKVFSEMSICAWVYLSQHAATGTANGIVTSHDHTTNSGLGIGMYTTDGINCYVSINAGNGSSRVHSTYWGNTNIKDGWHHICLAYGNDKKIHMYVDGKEDRAAVSYTVSFKQDYLDIFNWSTGYSDTGNYRPVCKVCDVRVYDHKLSLMEVKELSKGLMIHYAFNDMVAEPTTNVGNNASWSTYSSYWTLDERTGDGLKVTRPSSSTSDCVAIQNSTITSQMKQGDIWTFSCFLYKNGQPWKSTASGISSEGYGYKTVSWESRSDGYYRITFQVISTPGAWVLHNYFFSPIDKNVQCELRYMQFEKNDHATPYTVGSRTYTTAFDDSGNGYDAKAYNMIVSYDTNNGTLAAKFNGSTSYYEVPIPRSNMFSSPYTLSFWVNPADNDRAIYFGDHQTTGGVSMNFERKSGGKTRYYHGGSPDKEFNTTAPANTWTMITISSDGTNMRAYENGVLKETYKFTPTIQKPSGHMRIGRDSRSDYTALAGYISDFRWYATALSDEDIKILYESKAAVDKSSNFYTNEFTELNTTNVDITKKFTIKTNEIIESQENGFYKDGHMTSNTIYEI
jgi:hypothetical protein